MAQDVAKPTVCRLCQQHADLRKSHILPEFLYGDLYDDKHRFIGIVPHPEIINPYEQKGLRERLLCDRCEGLLNPWETYASRVLTQLPDASLAPAGAVLTVPNVDYTRFKLFQLSLIWRAGVATHNTFRGVDLGPHEIKMRDMLLSGDPGSSDSYGCVLIGFRGGYVEKVMKPPVPNRLHNHRIYLLVAAGLLWVYFVSSHSQLPGIRNAFLKKTGVLQISVGRTTPGDFLADLGRRLKRYI